MFLFLFFHGVMLGVLAAPSNGAVFVCKVEVIAE